MRRARRLGRPDDPLAAPLRELAAPDAYLAAVERDTLEAYEEFLAAYPDDPMAAAGACAPCGTARGPHLATDRRGRYAGGLLVLFAAVSARSSCRRCTPQAGAARLRAEPPASFAPIDYDVPPPSPEELPYVERPAIEFADADFPAPPPLPIYFLPPPPSSSLSCHRRRHRSKSLRLPIPIFVPIPVWCHRPAYVAPPPDNVIFNNVHNRSSPIT